MVHGTLAFLVLVVFALVGSELRGRLARRGLQAPAMEGLSFLIIGIALGEQGLGLFAGDLLTSLRVVVLLGLTWIGLVFGLQVEWRVIRAAQAVASRARMAGSPDVRRGGVGRRIVAEARAGGRARARRDRHGRIAEHDRGSRSGSASEPTARRCGCSSW